MMNFDTFQGNNQNMTNRHSKRILTQAGGTGSPCLVLELLEFLELKVT